MQSIGQGGWLGHAELGQVTPSADLADLTRRSVRGGLATVGARVAVVSISLASTVVLARLLTPDDFGVIAMVMTVTAFAGVFRDFGLSSASVHKGSGLTDIQASNLFWLNLVVGMVLTALVMAAAPLVVWAFDNPAMGPVTVLMAFTFLLASLGNQHAATLQRLLLFHRKACAEVSGALLGFVVTVALALRGYSYWSLAWGSIVGTASTSLLTLLLSPMRIKRPRRNQPLRDLLNFGGHVTAFEFINYFHRNLDNILIGRSWGAEALGHYSRAYQLLMFPITNLRAPINAVAFSAMSQLRDRPEDFRAYYLKVSYLLGLTSMPLVVFLAVAAEEVIELMLGRNWLAAVPIFQALAVTAFIQPVASLRGLVALSSGRSRDYLILGIANAAVVSMAFVAGLPWGPVGVAAAYGVAVYALLWPTLRFAFRATNIRMRDFWNSIAQSAVISLVCGGVVVLAAVTTEWFAGPILFAAGLKLALFGCSWIALNTMWPGGWLKLGAVRGLMTHLRE